MYMLNTNPMISRDAQAYCNSQGGHLVSYTSYDEQADVEGYFTNQASSLQREQPAVPAHASATRAPCSAAAAR